MDNNTAPEFSIVVPAYNGESYIRRCLDSLFDQTVKNIEVIVIDDHSEDSTISILEEISAGEERLRIIRKERNESQLAARIDGMKAAKGRQILFVDCDDYIEKRTCECLRSKYMETGADIIEFAYVIEPDGKEERIAACNTEDLAGITKKILRWEHPHIGCNKCYSHALVERFLEKTESFYCNMSEDMYHSVIFFTLAESYALIDDVLYHYVRGTGTSTDEDKITLNIDRLTESIYSKNEHLKIYLERYKREYLPDFDVSVRKELDNIAGICVGSSLGAYEKIAALRLMDERFGTSYSIKYENQHKLFDEFLNSGNIHRIGIVLHEMKRKLFGSEAVSENRNDERR